MIRTNATLTSIAATLLLSGTAFAAGVQPAAGEAPYFQPQQVMATSQLQRAEVRADALRNAPVAGNLPFVGSSVAASTLTRAEVRADAIAHMPAAGIGPVFNAAPVASNVGSLMRVSRPMAATNAMPATGEAPLFHAEVGNSTVQRADVRAQAVHEQPAAGIHSAEADAAQPSTVSRAAVREATRDAIAHGFRIGSGDLS